MKIPLLLLILAAPSTFAATLSCREDPNTREHFCYLPSELRANGELRSFPVFKGGPKGADRSGYLAVAHCKTGLLELRDRKGVIFAKNIPSKRHIKSLLNDACSEEKVKIDKKLK